MKTALITYSGHTPYATGDHFNENDDLVPYLQKRGLDVEAVIWDDPAVEWRNYTFALLKMPWDYHEKFAAFNSWLNKIESLGIRLLNDYATVRWNMNKRYLQEIAAAGFPVISSLFLEKGWRGDLSALFKELNTSRLVIKPVVSAGSRNTIVAAIDTVTGDQQKVIELLKQGDYIVQPMMEEIKAGEWSFLFFNGSYSHAVLKKPRNSDFRVQEAFGGTIEPVAPAPASIAIAESFVKQFAKNCLYARVDGLMVNGSFQLMELELTEPFLYLSYGANATENYYRAIVHQLQQPATG